MISYHSEFIEIPPVRAGMKNLQGVKSECSKLAQKKYKTRHERVIHRDVQEIEF